MTKETILNELLEGLDLDTPRVIDGLSRYEINLRKGEVKDNWRNIVLKPKPNARGYCYLNLQKDNNERLVISVQKLMMLAAFEGFDYRKLFKGLNLIVDHIDKNRSNNFWSNLKITTQSNNLKGRSTSPKFLTEEELEKMVSMFELVEQAKHGEKHSVYDYIASSIGCSSHTVQVKFLEWKKKQTKSGLIK